MVNGLAVEHLEARPGDAAEVIGMLSGAALPPPSGPALLIVTDADVRMVSGWEMRRTLGGLIGWRRARTIVRLATAEWRARRSRDADSLPPSRRGIVRAGLVGLIGAAIIPWTASAASARTTAKAPDLVKADEADVQWALGLGAVQRAVRTWGVISTAAYTVTSGQEKVLVLVHGRGKIVTLVDISAGTSSNPTVLSLGIAPTKAPSLRFYTVDGAGIADLIQVGNQVKAVAVSVQRPDVATLDISKHAIACFVACLSATVTVTCLYNCFGCVTGGAIGAIFDCPYCLLCAGPDGVKCAKHCF
jgi:hypothetical protein